MVGASGSLLAAKHGALIDAHQQVIRINRVVTRDFEEHVGSRTTLNLFWGHPAHLDAWLAPQRGPNTKPLALAPALAPALSLSLTATPNPYPYRNP